MGDALARGRELFDQRSWQDCVEEHALGGADAAVLDVLEAHRLVETGEPEAALALAERSVLVGEQSGDPDLLTLATLTVAMSLVRLGRGREALSRMDEEIVTISVDDVTPIVVGLAYCAATASCLSLYDLHRAREWTATLSSWCDDQQGLVPYRGHCLVHRAQIMTLQGPGRTRSRSSPPWPRPWTPRCSPPWPDSAGAPCSWRPARPGRPSRCCEEPGAPGRSSTCRTTRRGPAW